MILKNILGKIAIAGSLSCVLTLSSCATVSKPRIEKIEGATVVSPALKHAREYKGLKRLVAIARFTNETKYGQGFFTDDNNNRIGKQALDILSGKMLNTGKFILLERADMGKINAELSIEGLEPLKNKADYLIVGSITEFGRKEQSNVGVFSRVKKQVANAKVNVRLIDVRNGRVIYAEEGQGEATSEAGTVLGVGSHAGYDSTLNDKVLDAAIAQLASNIIENLLDKPWKAYILGEHDNLLIMSGGKSQNIHKGNEFDVFEKGNEMINPQTNLKIQLPGKKLARIRVESSSGDSIDDEVSFCSVVEGDISLYIQSKDYSKLYVSEIPKGEQ